MAWLLKPTGANLYEFLVYYLLNVVEEKSYIHSQPDVISLTAAIQKTFRNLEADDVKKGVAYKVSPENLKIYLRKKIILTINVI